jgi:hypothetical protein
MIVIKFLLFPLVNGLCVFLFLWSIKAFLFYPKKKINFRGKEIPFTPGFIQRLHKRYVDYVFRMFFDFLKFSVTENDTTSFIAEWEETVYRKAWNKFESIEEIHYVPTFFKLRLRELLAQLAYEFAHQFFRNFLPYFAEKYEVSNKVEVLREHLDPDQLLMYFNKYVYKWLQYIFIGFAILLGLGNMLIFGITLLF